MASDEDLKLSDTLRYYTRDSSAAKNLLYRRLRALANHETATKNLDKARSKNKDVQAVSDFCYSQLIDIDWCSEKTDEPDTRCLLISSLASVDITMWRYVCLTGDVVPLSDQYSILLVSDSHLPFMKLLSNSLCHFHCLLFNWSAFLELETGLERRTLRSMPSADWPRLSVKWSEATTDRVPQAMKWMRLWSTLSRCVVSVMLVEPYLLVTTTIRDV